MDLVMEMERIYLCIDLKTFYASVECVARNLDPFKTDLVVADPTRSKGTICLAISPKMKARGIKNRCRMFEIPSHVHPIIAKPRMREYIRYSAKIYAIYLKYVAKEDIHPYSIDEMFLDVTSYLKLYKKEPFELAKTIIQDIYQTTGITATAGIGTNLYLAKIALDLKAKKDPNGIAFLDIETYQKEYAHHLPITDFWQISKGTENRLHKLHLKDMSDIINCDPLKLYKEFGIKAELLIDHAKGYEPCTIKDIKNYVSKEHSLSNSQVLFRDYDYQEARVVLTEMVDNLVLQLVEKNLVTSYIGLYVGYSKEQYPPLTTHFKLKEETSSYRLILKKILEEYDYRISETQKIRRIGISFGNVHSRSYQQLSLFNESEEEEKETKLEQEIVYLKNKYGKNSLLRAISLKEEATGRERNQLIGGHNAE